MNHGSGSLGPKDGPNGNVRKVLDLGLRARGETKLASCLVCVGCPLLLAGGNLTNCAVFIFVFFFLFYPNLTRHTPPIVLFHFHLFSKRRWFLLSFFSTNYLSGHHVTHVVCLEKTNSRCFLSLPFYLIACGSAAISVVIVTLEKGKNINCGL